MVVPFSINYRTDLVISFYRKQQQKLQLNCVITKIKSGIKFKSASNSFWRNRIQKRNQTFDQTLALRASKSSVLFRQIVIVRFQSIKRSISITNIRFRSNVRFWRILTFDLHWFLPIDNLLSMVKSLLEISFENFSNLRVRPSYCVSQQAAL